MKRLLIFACLLGAVSCEKKRVFTCTCYDRIKYKEVSLFDFQEGKNSWQPEEECINYEKDYNSTKGSNDTLKITCSATLK